MIPTLTVADPENASLLFDIVNAELSKGGHGTDKTQRLCVLLIALHAEMTRTDDTNDDTNRETTP